MLAASPAERCEQCGQVFTPLAEGAATTCPYCGAPIPITLSGHIGRETMVLRDSQRVTKSIVALNLVVFVAMVAAGVKIAAPSMDELFRWGATFGPAIAAGQLWRFFTATFVHIGIFHLALNMYCLWGLGALAERFYAPRDYVLIYVLTGVASSVASVAYQPLTLSAGASGAIFGIAALMLATLKFGHLPIERAGADAAFRSVLQFAGINLVIGFMSARIDNAGHLGGFVSGGIIGLLLGKRLDNSAGSRAYRTSVLLAVAALLAAAGWLLSQHLQGLIPADTP